MRAYKTFAIVLTVVALAAGCSSSSKDTSSPGTTGVAQPSGTIDREPDGSSDVEGTATTAGGSTTSRGPIDASEAAYVSALERSFAADEAFPSDKAECAARAMVEAVGADTFVQNGVAPDDLADEGDGGTELDFALTEEQARAAVDGIDECVDLGAVMAQSFADDGDITDEQRACLERELTSDVVKDFMVRVLVASPEDASGFEVFEEIFTVMAGCGLDPFATLEDE